MSRSATPVKKSPKPQRGGFAIGLIVGLLLGLAVALAVALYVTKTPVPLLNKSQVHTPEQDAAEAERNKTWDPNAALAGKAITRPAAPAPVPATPASDTAIVPRPSGVVLPPPSENTPAAPVAAAPSSRVPAKSSRDALAILNGKTDAGDGTAPAKPAAAADADPFIYFVQVGAYSRPEDAEAQRAKMAMAGLRASITDREQNGRTVHRVRMGPFNTNGEADTQLERAKAIDAEATLVRVDRQKQ